MQYLLQINRIKLQDYIKRGLIVPDKYLDENKEVDIQSKNPNFLVVSDGYFKELNEYQILIEIIFTDDEKKNLHKVNDNYYFGFPLPLTRIKKVYVQNQNIKKHIEVQIQNGENGFLPKKLFKVYLKNKKSIFKKREYTPLEDEININDFEDQIRDFNKKMGMFAFVKNSEMYYCDMTQEISNYSKHYFSLLSKLLEKPIDNDVPKYFDILKTNEDFKELLYSNNQIDKEFVKKESMKIHDDELKTIFLELLNPTGTRKTLKNLFEKNEIELYLIGLIYYFRQKDSNKKDNFKINIQDLIPYEVAEISLAVLGIYFGYKVLRAEEKIDIQDNYFRKIFNKDKFNMKFKLECKLDYITIETIYNYCFKDKIKGYEYEYLSYPNRLKPIKIIKDINYNTKKEIYFDSECIKIKKQRNLLTGIINDI